MILSTKSSLQYYLLKNSYIEQDEDIIFDKFVRKEIKKGNLLNIGIKEVFFKNIIRKFGNLKCQICGAENLERGSVTKKAKKLATIEHVIPIALGGLKYNSKNFICTCSDCNGKRGLSPLRNIGNDMYKY